MLRLYEKECNVRKGKGCEGSEVDKSKEVKDDEENRWR